MTTTRSSNTCARISLPQPSQVTNQPPSGPVFFLSTLLSPPEHEECRPNRLETRSARDGPSFTTILYERTMRVDSCQRTKRSPWNDWAGAVATSEWCVDGIAAPPAAGFARVPTALQPLMPICPRSRSASRTSARLSASSRLDTALTTSAIRGFLWKRRSCFRRKSR